MENVTKMWIGPLPKDSPYVKPFRLYYIQDGEEKNWDLLKVHDSVAIVIYNKLKNVLVFVKQFRPAVYHSIVSGDGEGSSVSNIDLKKYPPSLGVTLELCAGIVDKKLSLVQIAQEEVEEECGYTVPIERFEQVMTFRSGVGSSGALMTLYYVEVSDADKKTGGGGVDGEMIEVVEYTIEEAQQLLNKTDPINSPPSCLLGITWFLMNKLPKHIS